MLKNYFKIALRNLKKHKGYTFINITGLAVGLACCLLIVLFVRDELSYDRYHDNADQIYRITLDALLGELPPKERAGLLAISTDDGEELYTFAEAIELVLLEHKQGAHNEAH